MLAEQIFDETLAYVPALIGSGGQQNVPREFSQALVGFHPECHRNTEAVFLLMEHFCRQQLPEGTLKQISLFYAFDFEVWRNRTCKFSHRSIEEWEPRPDARQF